jgi:hypothetical protein
MAQEKWTCEYLSQHLKNLHGSSNIKNDLEQESRVGFIVAHVRSNRYEAVELDVIVQVCSEQQ